MTNKQLIQQLRDRSPEEMDEYVLSAFDDRKVVNPESRGFNDCLKQYLNIEGEE